MKCPKCGNEYDGMTCPYCVKPTVLVNESDYQKRKEAWEKRQALQAKNEENEKSNSAKTAILTHKDKVKKILEKQKNDSKRKKVDALTDDGQENKDADIIDESFSTPRKPARVKNKRFYVALFIGILTIAGIIAIAVLYVNSMMSIYFKIDNSIYKNDWKSDVWQEAGDSFIWNADKSGLYYAKVPKEVNSSNTIQEMSAMKGEYFCAVTYDNVQQYYTIWSWNEDSEEANRLITSDYQLEIQYINEDGAVYYTETQIVGDGIVSERSLNYIDNEKKQTEICDNLRKDYIFLKNELIVYLSNDNNMYLVTFDKLRESTLLAANVSNVFGELRTCDGRYSEDSQIVHSEAMTSQIVYMVGDMILYMNMKNPSIFKELFKTSQRSIDVIYDGSSKYSYCLSSRGIVGMSVVSSEEDTQVKVSQTNLGNLLSGTEAVYINKSHEIIYIAENGKLTSVQNKDGNFLKKNIEEDRMTTGASTYIRLAEGDDGFLLVNNGVFYFYKDTTSSAILLAGYSGKAINNLSYYRGKIYLVDSNKLMHVFDSKGKLEETVPNTEHVWID